MGFSFYLRLMLLGRIIVILSENQTGILPLMLKDYKEYVSPHERVLCSKSDSWCNDDITCADSFGWCHCRPGFFYNPNREACLFINPSNSITVEIAFTFPLSKAQLNSVDIIRYSLTHFRFFFQSIFGGPSGWQSYYRHSIQILDYMYPYSSASYMV